MKVINKIFSDCISEALTTVRQMFNCWLFKTGEMINVTNLDDDDSHSM